MVNGRYAQTHTHTQTEPSTSNSIDFNEFSHSIRNVAIEMDIKFPPCSIVIPRGQFSLNSICEIQFSTTYALVIKMIYSSGMDKMLINTEDHVNRHTTPQQNEILYVM